MLARYGDFFALFGGFEGYVRFFLLDDGYASMRFFLPFDDFITPALPGAVEDYGAFMRASMEFVRARNLRIDRLASPRGG